MPAQKILRLRRLRSSPHPATLHRPQSSLANGTTYLSLHYLTVIPPEVGMTAPKLAWSRNCQGKNLGEELRHRISLPLPEASDGQSV